MKNLQDLAKTLLEKAGKATPGPWQADCYETERELYSVSEPTKAFHLYSWDGQASKAVFNDETAKYIAAASPDVITALAQAYLEAVEALREIEYWPSCTPHGYYSCGAECKNLARAFLSKWAAPGEGER